MREEKPPVGSETLEDDCLEGELCMTTKSATSPSMHKIKAKRREG